MNPAQRMNAFQLPRPSPSPAPADPSQLRIHKAEAAWDEADRARLATLHASAFIMQDPQWMAIDATVGETPGLAKAMAGVFPGRAVHWGGVRQE